MEDADLALYYRWLEAESRDSTYSRAYRQFRAAKEAGQTHAKAKREAVAELEALSVAFSQSFWQEKDYDKAFYIGFRLEEKLPQVSEADYPDKRKTYYKLGEAYYLFLDFHKSIRLLEKALSPTPLSFDDTANLDALNILGICHANTGNMEQSDRYFRAILLSNDIVLHRPLYNAYAISHLGCNEMIRGNYAHALSLSEAIWPVLREETDDYGHLAGMCYCRGRSYLEKGEYRQASQWIDSLVWFAPQDGYNPLKRIKQAYRLQADYYSALGDARLTKVYGDSLVAIYLASEEEYTSGYIARASQRFNTEKIADREMRLKEGRTRLIIISVAALLFLATATVILSLYRKKNAAYKALTQKAGEWARESGNTLAATDRSSAAGQPEPFTAEDLMIMSLIEAEMTGKRAYRKQNLTAESFADRLGIHRNTLSRVINKTTGDNFNQYVNSYRIKEAVRILSENNDEKIYIDELYERIGFANHTSFYRAFKQFTNLSPTEFRKSRSTGS